MKFVGFTSPAGGLTLFLLRLRGGVGVGALFGRRGSARIPHTEFLAALGIRPLPNSGEVKRAGYPFPKVT